MLGSKCNKLHITLDLLLSAIGNSVFILGNISSELKEIDFFSMQ